MSVGMFLIVGFGLMIILYISKRVLDIIEYKTKLNRRMDLYKEDEWNFGEEKEKLMDTVRDINS